MTRYLTFSAIAAVMTAVLVFTGCAHPPPVAIPATLRPPANEALAMTVSAQGVQVYECRVATGVTAGAAAGHAWAFVAPEAELFDAHGRHVGRIVGQVKARADAPSAGAIPWLLLAAQPSGTRGSFSQVTSIQRINTVGGLAPATPCTAAQAGTPARIHYTADYRFFSTRKETT